VNTCALRITLGDWRVVLILHDENKRRHRRDETASANSVLEVRGQKTVVSQSIHAHGNLRNTVGLRSEWSAVSRKYERRRNLHHPAGRGRFKYVVFLFQDNNTTFFCFVLMTVHFRIFLGLSQPVHRTATYWEWQYQMLHQCNSTSWWWAYNARNM
jgi:hypothetical protein